MARLQVGFARKDITPFFGVPLSGYFEPRPMDGILDPLEAHCIALRDGDRTALLFSCDLIGMRLDRADAMRAAIAAATGVAAESIFLACTHTHTGPAVGQELVVVPEDPTYVAGLKQRLCETAAEALADCVPASCETALGEARGISFVRRFRMADGSIRTNPGVKNPQIVSPIGEPDESVRVVRLVREGRDDIAIVQFQVHPDTIGGCKTSADFPRFVRETVESALTATKCVYFNGAQGDTNHIDVTGRAQKRDPAEPRAHAMWMGQTIGTEALRLLASAKPVDSDGLRCGIHWVTIPYNCPRPEQIAPAEAIMALHKSGRDEEIPGEGMERVTAIAEASRITRHADGVPSIDLPVSAVTFGEIAFVGFAGEPFTAIGTQTKADSPFAVTLPCCCTNGYEGYLPMSDAYAEGGYEARSSDYLPGVAETLIDEANALLQKLKSMEYKRVQQIAKDTMAYAKQHIVPGMNLLDIRKMCDAKMLELGADSFWYWDVGAFVFAGDETTESVSGKTYRTSDRIIAPNDIITIDLSPQSGDTWGDYARTIILQNGVVVELDAVDFPEWKHGLLMEELLHSELKKFAKPETTFHELYDHMNQFITAHGFVNLDFAGNLGHSIVRRKEERVYIEKGNDIRLGDVAYFTFEPHISTNGSKYGYKKENIYFFQNGILQEL